MGAGSIFVKGAREHNLKNVDLAIPRDRLVVITGLSGSGKSSLAFDTIYAEGQRRYVESLSAYARQFLGRMDKPDVDYIEGLSPAISIDQKAASRNPRSTVGTVTEIYDYLRLLFARIGKPHCPNCRHPITQQTVEQIVDHVQVLPPRTRIQVLAPLIRGRKGEHAKVLEEIRRSGYLRVRVDGEVQDVNDEITLEKNKKHTIEVVVDRLVTGEQAASRLADSLETAAQLSGGIVVIQAVGGQEMVFSQNFACVDCGFSFEEISPRFFSFNSPYGACRTCGGLGTATEIDPELVIPDRRKSVADGAVVPWYNGGDGYWQRVLESLVRHFGEDPATPVQDLPASVVGVILHGSGDRSVPLRRMGRGRKHFRLREGPFIGVIPWLDRRYREAHSDHQREEIEEFMSSRPCPDCRGARLRPEAMAVTVGDLNIARVTALTIGEAVGFFTTLTLGDRDLAIAGQILKEIRERLNFLLSVGLDYLTLDRTAGSLAGGESQRIRLATQIGSGLVGVLYILDEPTIGLHQRDNARLIATLKRLRDLGNTLLVVEHDEETIRSADYVIDIGPGAGEQGGRVVAAGTLDEILAEPASITGQYLSGRAAIPVPAARRRPDDRWLEIVGAGEHNLKSLTVGIPLGLFTCVTGVSGSGKSTLVNEILYRHLARVLHGARVREGEHQAVQGVELLDKVVNIDQSPIGRTPRSNPATYTGVFDHIRDAFARVPEAKVRGYRPGRFSFNVRGGRCEACRGDGIIKIEMHFLPDVYVPCEVCKGKRYNRETLEVRFKGKNIADILAMTVQEALAFFANIPRIRRRLETLSDVGLGYVRLGQPATTLSGGEAQRVKLATELGRRATGRTIYILDEPTTGLHTADIHRLLEVLGRLVGAGNTVVVIEHNLDVIKTADYLIDLGPEGGEGGGRVVAVGTPEEVAADPVSHTGRYLAEVLARSLETAGGSAAAAGRLP